MAMNNLRGWMIHIIQYLTQNELPEEEVEIENEIILSGTKKRLNQAKGLRVNYFYETLWIYHTTLPYSAIVSMVPVEINTPA